MRCATLLPMSPEAIAETDVLDVRAPDGRTLHTQAAGPADGDLVIVHHGTPSSSLLAAWWAEDAAARGIRLVGYDRPGYGRSDSQPGRRIGDAAADTAAIADAYGADRFRTWGISGGGPHALACAALLPDRIIAAAALASVAPYGASGLDYLAGMGEDNVVEFELAIQGEGALRPRHAEQHQEMRQSTPDGLWEMLRTLLPDADLGVLTGEMATFMHQWMMRGFEAGYEGWLEDDLAFVSDWGFRVEDIKVPTLVVQGRLDLMVPFAHGEWLAAAIPGATARLSDTDGHLTLLRDLGPVHEWLLATPS